jgi:NADPH2:quinone reductase
MKAIILRAFGGPEELKYEEVTAKTPGPGQVLVDVAAAGVNFMDIGTRKGMITQVNLPMTPGVEGAGRVVAVGSGVTGFSTGDRVAWVFNWGTYTTQMIIPEARLVPLPDDIDFETAAGIMMHGLAASNFALECYAVKPGDVALVHAAAGGVGNVLTQIIKLLGGRVIGRVSSAEKVAFAKAAGAEDVIVSKAGDFADQVLRLTEGQGVQAVYDGSGPETFEGSVRSLAYHGTLVLFGPLTGSPTPPIQIYSMPKSINLTYPSIGDFVRTPERLATYSAQLFSWIRAGKIKVNIGHRYPLAEAAQAHRDIESRGTTGKIVLIPGV